MSANQFNNWIESYHKRSIKAFEHTRAICYYVAASNRDPKKAFPTMQKFWPLPTDEKNTRTLDKTRAEEIKAKYEQAKQMMRNG